MSVDTLYNYNLSLDDISRELYTNVGANSFQLGTVKRAFKGGADFEVWDSAAGGNQLIDGIDYDLSEPDEYYTDEAGYTVYTKLQILNAVYQAGNIYVTYKTLGSYTDKDAFDNLEYTVNSITADYTITDTDNYNAIFVNSTAGDLTVTLPTAADNTNRKIEIIVTHVGGKVTIDGEGAETINDAASVYLLGKGDHVSVTCDGTEWFVNEMYSHYDTGWLQRSDWTNVHMGSLTVAYDGLSGTFDIGEEVTNDTNSATGIIQSDTGSVLILKNVTNCDWAENDAITGTSSGATANVDTPLSKNLDSNIKHDMILNLYDLTVKYLISTDGTDANSFIMLNTNYTRNNANESYGDTIFQVDTSNIKVQTATLGLRFVLDAGTSDIVDTDDYFYKAIVERRI